MADSRFQLDDLLPLVYDDLRKFASRELRGERSAHTLQTTALVHEAYVRMAKLKQIDWNQRDDVLRAAIGVMRRVLIDYARARNAKKREVRPISLECPGEILETRERGPVFDILALDEALERLREIEPAKAEVVELKYFGGQTNDETARILGLSVATIKRHWAFSKAWLFRELEGQSSGESSAN